jgi:CRP-like cAMP-binding protein
MEYGVHRPDSSWRRAHFCLRAVDEGVDIDMQDNNERVLLEKAARHNRVLDGLPDTSLRTLLAHAGLIDVGHDRVLYRQDRTIPALYFPTRGTVSLLVGAPEGAAVEVATVGNEGVVGITAVIGIALAPERAVVQVPGQAIRISKQRFHEVLDCDEQFSLAMRRYLYLFLRQVMQSAACNRSHTAEGRCARWLLMAHDRSGTDDFPLTQHFIADMMGTRRANVNEALGSFRRSGAIDYRYRRITILDRKRLESFSCPCYQVLRAAEKAVS